MSADHRRPVVAFVVLALAAAGLIGVQRADAQHGRFLAAVIAVGGQTSAVSGLLPDPAAVDEETARAQVASLGPAFEAMHDGAAVGGWETPTPARPDLALVTTPTGPTRDVPSAGDRGGRRPAISGNATPQRGAKPPRTAATTRAVHAKHAHTGSRGKSASASGTTRDSRAKAWVSRPARTAQTPGDVRSGRIVRGPRHAHPGRPHGTAQRAVASSRSRASDRGRSSSSRKPGQHRHHRGMSSHRRGR